jgi:hypothetical protein
VSILTELARIGNGIRSGISDVPSLVTNIFELDVHGVVTDARKVVGDAADVLEGAAGLGIEMGPVPIKYMTPLVKWADSPPLAAAQLVIEGQKKLTGSGSIETGSEYWQSAVRLEKAIETLIGAELDNSGWDGAAAMAYGEINNAHRKHVSNVSVADTNIGKVLQREAEQVRQTRELLDSTSQMLYDYGLATRAALSVPGANVAKILFADSLTASAAIATTSARMAQMLNDSVNNASEIRANSDYYESAQNDTSGYADGCGPFVDPETDRHSPPTRTNPRSPYIPREITPVYGPPASPLPVESHAPRTYDLPADLPRPHITPPSHSPGGLPKQ